MKIDINSLENAFERLNNYLNLHHEYQGTKLDEALKESCIQAFEYTYELSHKMLKRYLEQTEANSDEIGMLSFPDLIRKGASKGLLLNSWKQWSIFRDCRNKTSHSYDLNHANTVFETIPLFVIEVAYLINSLNKLQQKNED